MTSYDKVLKTRSASRPTSLDYISGIFESFTELHGDRCFGDNPAVVGGVALLCGKAVTVIGLEKGHDTDEENTPQFRFRASEGYRKALRLMRQAEKFKRPVVCLVDTAGASCTVDAELRGQGQAIGRKPRADVGAENPYNFNCTQRGRERRRARACLS
jgi:acetyl-CoA carboxylase carboxyl transferase subunit alpha